MKKYLGIILGILLIVGGIVVRGMIKYYYKLDQQEQHEQQRQEKIQNLKNDIADWEDEQRKNQTVVTAG